MQKLIWSYTYRNVSISISCQPSNFQIANYNIHPAPILTFATPLPINQTVHAHLVDASTFTVVNGGFQTGDVRVLVIFVYFSTEFK